MQVRITVDCDNDAFADGMAAIELAKILRNLANHCHNSDAMPYCVPLRDSNGNRVGMAITRDETTHPEPCNADRQQLARELVELYCSHQGNSQVKDGPDIVVIDMVADLCHWLSATADADWNEVERVTRVAVDHWLSETTSP